MKEKLTNEQLKARFSTHLKAVLSEMCRRVGVIFDDVDFSADNWFQQHKWTEEEQEDFEKWFVNYLCNSREARQELTTVYGKNKAQLRKAVKWFCFSYGWSFREKKETL